MGGISSAHHTGEFFFDERRREWRWYFGNQWWTFQPMYDDLDEGILRVGGCWVADAGQLWFGVDPEEWMRRYRWRNEKRRWRMERQRHDHAELMSWHAARRGMPQKMPVSLVEVVLQQAFDLGVVSQVCGK